MALPVTASLGDCVKLLEWLDAKRTKDKKYVCACLTGTNNCIQLWYNQINDMFRRTGWNDKATKDALMKFISQKKISPHAEKYRIKLEIMKESFKNQNLSKQQYPLLSRLVHWVKNLKRGQIRLDIQKIDEIIKNIKSFEKTTTAEDTIIYNKIVANEYVPNEQIESCIIYLLTTLNQCRGNINVLTTKLKEELSCQQ